MKRIVVAASIVAFSAWLAWAGAPESSLQAAIEKYNQAFRAKDVETIRGLLAPDVLLYEHSVRNDGLQDVFENHLKPEIVEFENLKLDFSDERITEGGDTAVLTRQYRVQGKLGAREIDAKGNETMAWKKINGQWRIFHIHYSHACPRPPAPRQ